MNRYALFSDTFNLVMIEASNFTNPAKTSEEEKEKEIKIAKEEPFKILGTDHR
ncbi:hypothetical protein [Microbulbifer variabilis]|uniref:hypothetical protein n=1 Tax=Microbulbifer variabilis TaxID=266805 RepID=UPI001CFE8F46|nr:hypothetical protein [Microbulbifer variabilis]